MNHPVNHPLRLATGSHRAGSGKGCAMNVISWENGDTTISDLPGCADRMLARIVQRVNDAICDHRDGDLLCPTCSLDVLELAHRTVGTSAHGLSSLDLQRVYVRVAVDQARQVQHLNTDPRVEAAIVAAERWAESPSAAARAAYAAANAARAAYAAANAAHAARAAYAAANAAHAAANATAYAAADAVYAASYAAANAAHAAHAAAYAPSRLALAHRAIDTFLALTGLDAVDTPQEATDRAVARMLAKAEA